VDLFESNSHLLGRAAILSDEKRNRRRKNPVLPGQLPAVLKDNRKLETMRFSFLTVLLKVTTAYHDNIRRTLAPAPMGIHKMWGKVVAGTAMRVTEDQDDTTATILLK